MTPKTTRTPSEVTQIAVMANDLKYVVKSVDMLGEKIDHNYVTKETFAPVQKIVYGVVGLILVSVIGAVIALVLRRP